MMQTINNEINKIYKYNITPIFNEKKYEFYMGNQLIIINLHNSLSINNNNIICRICKKNGEDNYKYEGITCGSRNKLHINFSLFGKDLQKKTGSIYDFQKRGQVLFDILKKIKKIHNNNINMVFASNCFNESENFFEGFFLRAWSMDYKTNNKILQPLTINIYSKNMNLSLKEMINKLCGINLCRVMSFAPPNYLYPLSAVNFLKHTFANTNVTVQVINRDEMLKMGMGALLSVGQGSKFDPAIVVLKTGSGNKNICFCGKGVTFDTGGINLKPSHGLTDMKFDMCGAAAISGSFFALSQSHDNILKKYNIYGILGFVENSIGKDAFRPSDIVTTMGGKTIEILNTDAEGRVILADLLTYGKTYHNPSVMISVATLTGAMAVALADQYGGLFSNNDFLTKTLIMSGKQSGDPLWNMPMGKNFNSNITNPNSDIGNLPVNCAYGGQSTSAAKFLEYFADNKYFAHLDIANVSNNTPLLFSQKNHGSGFGVRLLLNFIINLKI